MKTGSLLVAVALALSTAAANAQQNNKNSNSVFGGNRGGFGNNNNNGGFFGQNGRNGQNNQNQNNRGGNTNTNNNKNNNAGNNNQNNNTGKGNQNNNNGKSAASTSVAATSSAAAAVTTTAAAAQSTSTSAAADSADAQSSLTLDPNVVATGFENNGQDTPTAGQVASLTSSNNFINFCLTVPNLPITNGKQIATGSCNPAPMGIIPSSDNMPSAKFTNPANGDTLPANTQFTVTMAINNMETGNFVNADENYFAAPQQLNSAGQIIGHSHIVIENLSALDQTTPTNPKNFSFFKGLNDAAVNGVLSVDVTGGLPAGFYRIASINTAANHQPALVPIAQHGSLDDAVYFTLTDNGAAAAAPPAASSAAAVAASSVAAVAASSAAPAATASAVAKGKAPAAPIAPAPPAKGKAPATPARVAQPAQKAPTPPSRGQNGRFRRSRVYGQL